MGELVWARFLRAEAVPRRGWDQSKRLWWLLWSRCPGVGWSRLCMLASAFGSLEQAWVEPLSKIVALPGWGPRSAAAVERYRRQWGTEPLPDFRSLVCGGRAVLLPGDPSWPQGLAGLERPPAALHWRGRGSLWPLLRRRCCVAVVGTRRPSPHGLSMARHIGAALARGGWPVVSGLAEGIDAAAHQGCLEKGGAPVGILGTPLDRVYPRHHSDLQLEVARRGLLVSELAAGSMVRAGHFACRNRLQVALSAALVVVECPTESGALHSAELAWHQELPLWVVPADAAKRSARGSNALLARGVTPLLTAADLIEQLGPGPLLGHREEASDGNGSTGLDQAQKDLLEAVGGGASLEQLSLLLEQPARELAPRLLDLELVGLLRAEPGLCWRPC